MKYPMLQQPYLKHVIAQHEHIIIASDGGCRNKSGHRKGQHVNGRARSACAYRLEFHNYLAYGGRSQWGHTNNYQELTGVLLGLERINPASLKKYGAVIISDSKYIDNAVNLGWINKWHAQHFKRHNQRHRPNWKLWKKLYHYNQEFNLTFKWIKGHHKNVDTKQVPKWQYMMNNFCDQYLNVEMDKMTKKHDQQNYQDKLP